MKLSDLDLEKIPIWAVGGNFIGHMKQAGEAKTLNTSKPKFLFSIWFPGCGFKHPMSQVDGNQPLYIPREIVENSSQTNICVQTEPELGIMAELHCENYQVKEFTVTHFFPANEISIRGIKNEEIYLQTGKHPDYMVNAHRKNWGPGSQGICPLIEELPEANVIPDSLTIEANIFLDGKKIPYGIKTKLGNMTYKNALLWQYIVDEFNFSENNTYLRQVIDRLGTSFKMFICNGATLYYPDFIFEEKNVAAGHKIGEIVEVVISGKYRGKEYFQRLEQEVLPSPDYLEDYVNAGFPQHRVLSQILHTRFGV